MMAFPVHRAVKFRVKPMGAHTAFSGEYKVVVQRVDIGSAKQAFSAWNHTDYICEPDCDGTLNFEYTASGESQYNP